MYTLYQSGHPMEQVVKKFDEENLLIFLSTSTVKTFSISSNHFDSVISPPPQHKPIS